MSHYKVAPTPTVSTSLVKKPPSNAPKYAWAALMILGIGSLIGGIAWTAISHDVNFNFSQFTPMDLALGGSLIGMVAANRYMHASGYRKTWQLTQMIFAAIIFGVASITGHQLIHDEVTNAIVTVVGGLFGTAFFLWAPLEGALDYFGKKRFINAITEGETALVQEYLNHDPFLLEERHFKGGKEETFADGTIIEKETALEFATAYSEAFPENKALKEIVKIIEQGLRKIN